MENDRVRQEQEEAIRRYRESINRSVDADERLGNYAYNPDKNTTEEERLREDKQRCDENEQAAKQEYERLNCESATGLSADQYRHEAIVDKAAEEREAERLEAEKEKQNSHSL